MLKSLKQAVVETIRAEMGDKFWILRATRTVKCSYTYEGSPVLEVSRFPKQLIDQATQLCWKKQSVYLVTAVRNTMNERETTEYSICTQFDGDSLGVPHFSVSQITAEEFVNAFLP